MRKIDEAVYNAVTNGMPLNQGNTKVDVFIKDITGDVNVYLWNNHILTYNLNTHKIEFNCQGWLTQTTLSRLRAFIPNLKVKDHCLYLNGKQISTNEWIEYREDIV